MEIKHFLIQEDVTVIKALNQLDLVSKKILFVVRDNKLVASLTDGDIRRWILKKGDLNTEISNVANYSPIYINQNNIEMAKKMMRKHFIESIPVVDSKFEIKSIMFLNDET